MSRKYTAEKQTHKSKPPLFRRKGFLWPVGIIVGLILVTMLAFRLSPWPGALIIRWEFNANGGKTTKSMEAHEPKSGIAVISDQQYHPDDHDAKLDVYMPEDIQPSDKKLPIVIWTHGGAWLSGSKNDLAPYLKLIAKEGYTVIAPNYSLAPGKTYPTPVHQLNAAHAFVQQNAHRFHADTSKIILAGDSAGSQLSAQIAALITNPGYAAEVGVTPNLKPENLKGLVLNCGIYKMADLAHPNPNLSKIVGWGSDVTVWAYSGTHDFSDSIIQQMSPYYHVTKDFPPTYITGGNADPLTNAQSKPFAEKLLSLGVSTEELFYPSNHQPGLPHEYQFNLDTQEGQSALQATLSFIKARTE